MLTTTHAIVLALRRHSDKAMILSAYTRAGGRQEFMVYGVGGKRIKQGVFAPLQVIELTYQQVPNRNIHQLRDARLVYVPSHPDDISRQTVALFIGEVLFRTISHPEQDDLFYNFLLETVRDMDTADDIQNVHLRFMLGLCNLLGYAIDPESHPELVCIPKTREARQQQITALCVYLQQNIENWQLPRSLPVLFAVFEPTDS